MARLYELTGSAPSAYGGSAAGQSGTPIDYDRLGQAVASAMAGTGLGNSQIILDGRMVGETVEPYASRATYQRTQRSIRGRMARLVSM